MIYNRVFISNFIIDISESDAPQQAQQPQQNSQQAQIVQSQPIQQPMQQTYQPAMHYISPAASAQQMPVPEQSIPIMNSTSSVGNAANTDYQNFVGSNATTTTTFSSVYPISSIPTTTQQHLNHPGNQLPYTTMSASPTVGPQPTQHVTDTTRYMATAQMQPQQQYVVMTTDNSTESAVSMMQQLPILNMQQPQHHQMANIQPMATEMGGEPRADSSIDAVSNAYNIPCSSSSS